jgi:hypothetical protein
MVKKVTTPTVRSEAGVMESVRLRFKELEDFQRSRPDLPQGDFRTLSRRDLKKIVQAQELEEAAKKGPEMVAMLKRYHKTGWLSSSPSRPRKITTSEFYIDNENDFRRCFESITDRKPITINGLTDGNQIAAFTGTVQSIKNTTGIGDLLERWRIKIRL